MRVSLIFLRLELADDQIVISELNYQADGYIAFAKEKSFELDLHDLSFTLQPERIVEPKTFKEIPLLHLGKREIRDIVIESHTIGMDNSSPSYIGENADNQPTTSTGFDSSSNPDHQASESSESGMKAVAKPAMSLQYFSGNPSVEVVKGIMHLYKDKFLTPLDPGVPRSEMICMLGVPAKYTCQDLQLFIAPARDTLEHIKILRDSIPNQYMVLLKFRDQLSADEFFQEYEGKQYSMMESECTHLVYVAKVETVKSSEGGYLPVTGLTELPTCPVCLERMDESVAGILTVLCNHSFHNDCLMKWQDSCCPVCRFHQSPEPTADQTCSECDSKESLWICLVCGHIGCGRYQEQHAYQHYQQTAHTFSMQLGNHRVWDYTGDNYVHRLIQSKGDGKLVALDHNESMDSEKMDSITLEYTYLLTNQLESQRLYFEEKIEFLEKDAYEKMALMESSLQNTTHHCRLLEQKLLESEKERKHVEKKYENIVGKATKLNKDLREEIEMNTCLRENQSKWQEKVEFLEARLNDVERVKTQEVKELQDEVADLIKHLELQAAVGNAEQGVKDDIQGGQVFLDQSSSSPNSGSRTKTRYKKR